MRLAIISDTHGNVANFKKIVDWLNKEKISLILHCGDIGNPESLKESLADFKGEFFGVLGNMDKDYKIEIEEYQDPPRIKVFEEMAELEIGSKKIAIIHRPDKTKELTETGKYDLVLYGHTHKPWEEKTGNCRLINPGEAAGQFYKPTFAVYDTDKDGLELKVLEKLKQP
ncbi:metallophosphoesterase [Patescibacteria group bacterium]|nr:metallophosphoesterase [Patescibacteria group bacterium]